MNVSVPRVLCDHANNNFHVIERRSAEKLTRMEKRTRRGSDCTMKNAGADKNRATGRNYVRAFYVRVTSN